MLMDLFFRTLPPNVLRKRRVHFHAFMIDVHKRIHATKARLGHSGGDPIAPVARELAQGASVLCFDEFQVRRPHYSVAVQAHEYHKHTQVTDIADAMILRRLLEGLLEHGVVCVITSKCVSFCLGIYIVLTVVDDASRHPDDLYKNGIQRSSFIPAIELLKSHFDVTDLDSGTGMRLILRSRCPIY